MEKTAINLTTEQIEEARALGAKLTEAISSSLGNDAILGALTDLAKFQRRLVRPASEAQVTVREDGVRLVGATTTIKCEECGRDHTVKVQDARQVTRCPECQKKHRNAKRAENRKVKRAEVRAQKEADAALAADLLAKYKAAQQAEQ